MTVVSIDRAKLKTTEPLLLQDENAKIVARYFYQFYSFQAKVYHWETLRPDVVDQFKQVFGANLVRPYTLAENVSLVKDQYFELEGLYAQPLIRFVMQVIYKDKLFNSYASAMEDFLLHWQLCTKEGRSRIDGLTLLLLAAIPK